MIGKAFDSPIRMANEDFGKAAERPLSREERDNKRRAELGGYKMSFLPIERHGSGQVRRQPGIGATAFTFGGGI